MAKYAILMTLATAIVAQPCAWSGLGLGVGPEIRTVLVYEDGAGPLPSLYVGGGLASNGIARWVNGATWLTVGPGVQYLGGGGSVNALVEWNDGTGPALYATGWFDSPGSSIARWNGFTWTALGAGLSGAFTSPWPIGQAMAVFDDGTGEQLYVGGNFTGAGGVASSLLARWDGAVWSAIPGGGPIGLPFSMAVHDDGSGPALFVGGQFPSAGGVLSNGVIRWDGTTWSSLAGGMDLAGNPEPRINALAVYDDGNGPVIYAAGEFTAAGGVPAQNIARWDGSAWSSPGGASFAGYPWNPYPTVQSLAVHDDGTGPALYVGGTFSAVSGLPVNDIARWNGSSWSAVGAGVTTPANGRVAAMTTHDDGTGPALVAGGLFTAAGGVALNNIAEWDCGSSITLSATQASPGAPVYVANANIIPGNEYLNLFSIDPCPGGPGTGSLLYFTGCVFTPANIASLVAQITSPLGTAPFRVQAPAPYAVWGPFNVAPIVVDAICIDVTLGVIGPTSPVVRITVQ